MTSELSPLQAGLRFGVEVAALVAWAMAAWDVPSATAVRVIAAVAVTLAAAVAWATFRVPGDASASGGAPVPTPGPVRLVLELVMLLGGAVAVAATGHPWFGAVLAALVTLHYVTSPARVRWLLSH